MNCTARKVGRPGNAARRRAYFEQFNLPEWERSDHKISAALLAQLDACKSDIARRLILGVPQRSK